MGWLIAAALVAVVRPPEEKVWLLRLPRGQPRGVWQSRVWVYGHRQGCEVPQALRLIPERFSGSWPTFSLKMPDRLIGTDRGRR